MEAFWIVLAIVSIIVGLPCLILRPLFLAVADRISGKKSNAREIQEMREKINCLEQEVKSLRVQVIHLESNQEFSNNLLEDLKSKQSQVKE